MITTSNVFAISHEAYMLWRSEKTAIGRALRRFLLRVTDDSQFVIQSFAFSGGYSPTQLEAMDSYAKEQLEKQAKYLPSKTVEVVGTLREDMFGLVSNSYSFVNDIKTASVAELRDMVKTVAILAESMHEFACSVNATALVHCPTYTYRGKPCSITCDDELWMVSGQDALEGGGGVLEWCYDEDDAKEILAAMMQHPHRFQNLSAEPFMAPVTTDA